MPNISAIANLLVASGLLTSFFVMIEPAPTDILMLGAAGASFLSGRAGKKMAVSAFLFSSIYIICIIAASIGSSVGAGLLWFTIATRIYLLLLVYAVSTYIIYNANGAQNVVLFIIFSGIACASIVILAKFNIIPYSEIFFRDEFRVRMKGTFNDPNVMGPFLCMAFMMVIVLLIGKWSRTLALAAAAILFAILLSGSRGAILSLGIGIVVFGCLLWGDNRINRKPIQNLILASLATGAFITGSIVAIEMGGFKAELAQRLEVQTYDTDRFGAQRELIVRALEHPLGQGASSANRASSRGVDPHNVYIKVLFEGGVIGFFGYMGLITIALYSSLLSWRNKSAAPQARVTSAAVFSLIASQMVLGLFIDTTHWRHIFVLIGIAVAMPYSWQAKSISHLGERK